MVERTVPQDAFSGTWRQRLEAAGAAVDELRAAYEDELELRDQLILEAIDAGVARVDVARWSRVGKTRVAQIIATRALELQEAAEAAPA